MISTTYKEDALAFVGSVAAGKAQRTKHLTECKKEVLMMLNGFRKKQMDMRKSIMHKGNELRQSLAEGETQRQHSFQMFSGELAKEGQKRMQATAHRAGQVRNLRKFFQKEFGELRSDIQNKAHQLRTKLQDGEKERMAEFKRFEGILAVEKKERLGQTKQMKAQLRELLSLCRVKQQHIKDSLSQQFSFARAARHEIQMAWQAVHMGTMPIPHMPGLIQPAHAASPTTSEISTQPMASFESEVAPEVAPKSTKRKLTLNDKVKATLAGSAEGFRFSEILRSLGDTGKPELRDALDELMAQHEVLKDENDRYHLV